ncbi:MAG TPA: hydrogenase, partial [Phycisphaerae bacterium]|nr:hydrogenase [Phycisphaerae bacterium]
MAFAMILFPLLIAGLAAAVPSNRWRPWLLPATAVAHMVTMLVVLLEPSFADCGKWLKLDPASRVVMLVVDSLFMLCAFYAVGYLHKRQERPNRVFCACMLAFPGIMSMVTWSHHLGLMWVAIEGTTLITAPLIYFNHTPRSIEA